MVGKLFADRPPEPEEHVLDPGCGQGAFIAGVLRWCAARGVAAPRITGVESDPRHATCLRERYAGLPNVEIRECDFLSDVGERYHYVIGNPPYVALTSLGEGEKAAYRRAFETASGRFDLYLLFFEQALRLLAPKGRLVFITPEKFLYVQTAGPLRALLSRTCIEELHFLPEDTFEGLVTYPLVTTLSRTDIGAGTRVIARQGSVRKIALRAGASSWLPAIGGTQQAEPVYTLSDVCVRISCGVATGADSVFVARATELAPPLRTFAYPTLAGRDLAVDLPPLSQVMLLPYTRDGRLIPEDRLGALGDYLNQPQRREKLLSRTCVAHKPWYAFHETPPLRHLLRPKLLCKDIAAEPFFVRETKGCLIPRHSTYYIVPADASQIDVLGEFLNSESSADWLRANCQRAANNYLRLQSHVLKQLPVPEELAVALGASPFAFADLAA